jgi:cytochrome P450
VGDEALTDEQIAAELHTIMVTGSETTELSVAATLYYLAQHPEQLEAVRADRSLIGRAFAEAIRYDHPTNMLCRAVKRDVEVGGARLQVGQGVLLVWASANRDEAVFAHGDRFDVGRPWGRSLLFGHGQHKCLGEHLAMRMGTVILEEFFDVVADYEVDVDRAERMYGEFLKGFTRLPIRFVRR